MIKKTLAAALLLPGLAQAQTGIEMLNGFPEQVSGAQDEILTFYLNVPSGLTRLSFMTLGGTGDPDIYVNFGQPYLTTADPTPECVSESTTAVESCHINNPAAGLWYVEVYGFEAFANVGLLGIASTLLVNDTPVTIAGADGTFAWYSIDVPSGRSRLTVTTTGGTGDPDLFVVEEPDLFAVQETCFSDEVGPEDSCTVNDPVSGRWYIFMFAFEGYSGVALRARYSGGGGGGGALPAAALGGVLLAGLAALARRRIRGRPAPVP